MRRRVLVVLLAVLALPAPAQARSVYARVTADEVVLGNSLVERRWARDGLVTRALADKRAGGRTWSAGRRDFALDLAGRAQLGSDRFRVAAARVTDIARGGLRVTMDLVSPVPGLTATRVAEVWPGVAGFRTQTILHPAAGLALSGATLDEAAVADAAPTLHAFRAGSDWREPGWTGPQLSLGDAHAGDWRDTRTAGAGAPPSRRPPGGRGRSAARPRRVAGALARRARAVPRHGAHRPALLARGVRRRGRRP